MAKTTPNHTQTVSGWAAHDSSGKITPYTFKRRENGVTDVTIKILYCGICHTDVHHAKDDWGITMYPVVPGHEITGVITKVGSDVEGFKEGDKVGVGCLAASCLDCEYCKTDQENYCEKLQFVYNGIFWDGSITYGGYSQMLVVDYRYVGSAQNLSNSNFITTLNLILNVTFFFCYLIIFYHVIVLSQRMNIIFLTQDKKSN